MNELTDKMISDRLGNLTTANIGGEHTGGGDSLLPKRLQGSCIDLPRMPTFAEVKACVHHHDDHPDYGIMLAAESIWREEADLTDWPLRAIDDVCFEIDDTE